MNNNQTTNDGTICITYPQSGEVIESPRTKMKYTVGAIINSGFYGIVYNCWDSWGNDLALKILKPQKSFSELKIDHQEEYIKLSFFRHPNITYVYDAFERKGLFYIIMERCTGTISDLLDIPKVNAKILLRHFSHSVLQAIHFIHTWNYVHLDLHIGNIFYTFVRDEVLPEDVKVLIFKVGDLGVSQPIKNLKLDNIKDEFTTTEAIEPQKFGQPDQRVDIFHLGLVFLQILQNKKMSFTKEQILNAEPYNLALSMNSPLGNIIANTLHPYVGKRTNSALELWTQLDKVLPKLQ